jgi:ribosomal protein S18 acetylase RimI-like enzyme
MTPQIRSFREEDAPAVIALWKACGLLQPYHDPARELDFLAEAPNAVLFLAFAEDRLAGSVMVGHDGHRAWMYRVAVDPALQRRGIGRAMVAQAESWTIARGLPKLMLLIREENENVVAFYEHLAYREEERTVMSKSFAPQARPAEETNLDVVITYLEMTERPTRPTVPAPAGEKLALLRVEMPTVPYYRYLYERVGDPIIWYERKLLSDQALRAILDHPKVELYVPYVNGEPAGYVEIDRRPAPDVSLNYFGLMPEFIGRGLGWYFLNWAIDTAWTDDPPPQRLIVDTCTLDHARALQTYQRAGFKPYNQVRKSIIDPRLTGKVPMQYEPRLP